MTLTPAGYMAKHVVKKPDWLDANHVVDVYSVSSCVSRNFADYVNYWRHNGYWLFDSPKIIESLAREHSIDLNGTSLFYYEAYGMQFIEGSWTPFMPEASVPTMVAPPAKKCLEGFDVVTFFAGTAPECSPLSCNALASDLNTNAHCLFDSFEEAETALTNGAFNEAEPGPYRIFAVYSVQP